MGWTEAKELHRGRSSREGLKLWTLFVLALGVGLAAAFWLSNKPFILYVWGTASIGALPIFLRFFRDFEPHPQRDDDVIVAPAHGVVDTIERIEGPNPLKQACWKVSIYLSLRDVHVQNAPISGRLRCQEFQPGARRRAVHSDASQRNEALILRFEQESNPARQVALKLIAGIFVRRIVPWINVGDAVHRGQRISLIRFGSRVDVYIPAAAALLIRSGDRVIGSKTILARWPAFHCGPGLPPSTATA